MATVTWDFLFIFFLVFFFVKKGYSDKVAGKIYTDLRKIAPCVRLTNATHEIGCTSSMGGHVGVVHLVQSQDDINWLIENGDHSPYIPLFTSTMFNDQTLKVLVDKELINGALVIFAGEHGQAPKDGFSPDVDCPNDGFGLYSDASSYGSCRKVKWNRKGNGMSFISYGIPVFALYDEDEVNDLIKCFNDYNKPVNGSKPDFPLCGVELKDFMFAAKDTPTCMRKSQMPSPTQNQFCDPLGDYNVWGTLYPITQLPKKGDIVVAAAKLDSSSFFHDLIHGAENDASGVIALLAAASALGEMKRNNTLPPPAKPIMFTLFQGESWDYIGSSRMVYDMDNKAFPPVTWKVYDNGSEVDLRLNTSNIGYFLELSQVGLGSGSLWAHSDPESRADKEVDAKVEKMIKILQDTSHMTNISIENPSPSNDQPLPPASLHRFLMSNKQLPGIVLTDHKDEFLNKYYNSRFDNPFYVQGNYTRIGNSSMIYLHNNFTKRLTEVATTVANTLYTLANNGTAPAQPLKASEDLIGHLVYCSFFKTDCSLFKSVYKGKKGETLPSIPLSRYVSVNTANNTLTTITHDLLLYLTGEYLETKDCSSEKPFVTQWKHGNYSDDTICVNGTVYYSVAESPAFKREEYDSTEYSTWAESTWPGDLSVRMFLISSPQRQAVTLASGILITLFSFAVVIFIHRKAELLFTPIDIPPNPDADS